MAIDNRGAANAVRKARPDCLVHIGYHRTGTSFLQTELFTLIPGAALTMFADEAERIAADPALRLAILTDEGLSSDLERDKPEMADELFRRFPDARVLIGVRSQYTIMRGIYHLHVKDGGTEDYESFVAARCGGLFNYDRMVDAYRSTFGAEKVFVLLQEDLSREPLASMAAVLQFAGIDPAIAAKVHNRQVKPSAGDLTMRILRQRNRLIAPLRQLSPALHYKITRFGLPGSGFIDQTSGKTFRLPTERVRDMICDAYSAGNALLFTSLRKNIADYDYPRPERTA